MDQARLIEKLRSIEALFAGATTPGERDAAAQARERIRARLEQMKSEEPVVEYRFSLSDPWSRKVFVALLRRYGLKPYRYPRQRHTTVMARGPRRFFEGTLWPEYMKIAATLRSYLDDMTERVIAEAVHSDSSEAAVEDEPDQLPGRVD